MKESNPADQTLYYKELSIRLDVQTPCNVQKVARLNESDSGRVLLTIPQVVSRPTPNPVFSYIVLLHLLLQVNDGLREAKLKKLRQLIRYQGPFDSMFLITLSL